MGGFKDDFDDLEEELELDDADGADDDFAFDDEDSDGKTSGKKGKSESGGFNRDSYYFYKDKLVQLSGTIRPKERSKDGKVISLEFKTDDKIYSVIMDDMGKKLVNSCLTGLLLRKFTSVQFNNTFIK